MVIKRTNKPEAKKAIAPKADFAEYVLTKGSSRLMDARIARKEIRLYVNGPAMLFGSARILTSLDMPGGATHQAWKKLAASLTCTSLCGHNGKTKIPLEVATSRIGTHIEFSTGPMAMYQSTVVIKPKKDVTLKQAIDEAFGNPGQSYLVVIVPEPASGHLEHDASIFEPNVEPGSPHDDHNHGGVLGNRHGS